VTVQPGGFCAGCGTARAAADAAFCANCGRSFGSAPPPQPWAQPVPASQDRAVQNLLAVLVTVLVVGGVILVYILINNGLNRML
jgi:uncharacterized membrane protein YvbJ